MENEIKEIIEDIKYGSLRNTIQDYDRWLIEKILLIYVEKVNDTYNIPYNFLDNIIEKIESLEKEEWEI